MRFGVVEGGSQKATATEPWYAVYTKHQHEKRAADLLRSKGMEVFLPLYHEPHRWKDRTQIVSLPLFPCYLFVRTDLAQKVEILSTAGVFGLVGNGRQACPVPESEIEAVQKLVRNSHTVRPHPFLKSGDHVRICRGALAGIEGILTRVKNQYRVVISVDLLNKSLAVEVDFSVLQAIHSFSPSSPPPLLNESRRTA